MFNQEEYVLFPLLFLLKNVFKPRSADLAITLGTWNWSLPWTILLCKMWTSFTLVVQLLSCVWLFATPWTATCQASLYFTISRSLLKIMSIELVMSCSHRVLCHPLLLLPSFFPPASRSFLMSGLLTSGGQSTGASTSVSVLPMNIQDWFPLG